MTEKIFVLITGANRGIGRGLLTNFVARPNHTVIAGLRDVNCASSQSLQDLPHGDGSSVVLVKLDSSSEDDAEDAVKALVSEHSLEKLDIVIANAGISSYFGKATVTPAKEMFEHFKINTVAPLLLFQATVPLLRKAPAPRFVVLSSGAGSLSGVEKLPVENTAYGASKAAVNFVTRRIHYENPEIIAFPINPGWLQTDLGNHAAKGVGMSVAPVAIKDGVAGIVDQIDKATRSETSGKFMTFNGDQLPW